MKGRGSRGLHVFMKDRRPGAVDTKRFEVNNYGSVTNITTGPCRFDMLVRAGGRYPRGSFSSFGPTITMVNGPA
jgi:hypothetical protein